MIRPPLPRPGERIALVAPAGPLAAGAVERAERRVRALGFTPVAGLHARGRAGFLSAPDDARAADLSAALQDETIAAVWCLRGGYGTMRIVDRIDWAAFARKPKPLIGFSDNTALHLAAQGAGVVSFHGPHPATRSLPRFSRESLHRVMCRMPAGPLPFPRGHAPASSITPGVAEGELTGGNLSLVAGTLGTPWAIQARGRIIFLEEVGEVAYRLDRLLTQLILAGVFRDAAGVVVGAVTETPPDEHSPSAEEVVRERLGSLGIPVAMGFPFGHVEESWTLPLGVRARLEAGAGSLTLLEPALEGL